LTDVNKFRFQFVDVIGLLIGMNHLRV